MEARTIQFIANSCGGKITDLAPERAVPRICTDSRAVKAGDLFLAIPGEKFDGHDFIPEVMKRGAIGVVMSEAKAAAVPGIVVKETRAALGEIGAAYRREFGLRAIAVAGSNGKTTTKELLAAVLRQRGAVVASAGSFNNDIGVPLTLLEIETKSWAGVFEAGTNHPGELKPLLKMIQPEIGVITSIGREHLEYFGDLEGVLREEGGLAEALPSGGLLAIHGEAFGARQLIERTKARVVKVGFAEGNDWRIMAAHFEAEGTHFRIETKDARYAGNYNTKLLGTHHALNATHAAVVGAELGLSKAEIQAGLDTCCGAKMRLQPRKISGFLVLDDAYNANADSMNAALDTLGAFPCAGKRIAVLGDMAELGAASAPAHEEIGRRAAERHVDCLVTVGKNAELVAAAAKSAGLQEVIVAAGVDQAGPAVREIVREGDVVLVKASRSAALERVVDYLALSFGATK